MKRQSLRFENLICYDDGRVYCKKKKDFLNLVLNYNRDSPYFNTNKKRVTAKILIAETFITLRPMKSNEKVIHIDGNIRNHSIDNLRVVSQEKKYVKRKRHGVDSDDNEFINWNETALYC